MSTFFIVVVGIAWIVSLYTSPTVLYVIVGVVIVLQVVAYWRSHEIVIKMTGAREVTREEFFDYWNSVENLCIGTGLPMPRLYVIDDPSPNAFATGRSPEYSAICCTTGLLEVMNKTELEGVIAHELAHIANRDTLIMTVTVVLFSVITILLDIMVRIALTNENRSPAIVIVSIVAYTLLPIVLTCIRLAVSRQREFQADATAAIFTRYPEGLAAALTKIKESAMPMRKVNTAASHLFISDPLVKNRRFAWMSRLFDTHPPIDNRIAALQYAGTQSN